MTRTRRLLLQVRARCTLSALTFCLFLIVLQSLAGAVTDQATAIPTNVQQ